MQTPTVGGFCMRTVTGVHRLQAEHDNARLYVELSGEDGAGPWTVLAVDREERRYTVAQAETKTSASEAAAHALTELLDH